ncbi:MAG: T9SS type A sorting domain-containing protein [Bacteroidota bacterium]
MKMVRSFFLFLWALLLTPILLSAQVDCSLTQGSDDSPVERDCYLYEFPYFLKYNDGSIPAPTSFQTCSLFVEGYIYGEGALINAGLTTSMFNVPVNNGELSITGNTFRYEYNSDTDLIDVPFGNGNLLFTIVAEGIPGDTLDAIITNVAFFDGCTGAICDLSNPSELLDFVPITVKEAAPCTSTDWEITLGNETIVGDLVKIPVVLNSLNGVSLTQIDVRLNVADEYGIIVIDAAARAASEGSVDPGASLEIDGFEFYYQNVSSGGTPIFYPDGTVLFDIYLTSYTGNTIYVDFDFARIKNLFTQECCSPVLTDKSVIIPGDPPCQNNELVLTVGDPLYSDCEVRFPVRLDDALVSFFNITAMLIELEVDLGAGASLNVSETEASVETLICEGPCPLYTQLNGECMVIDGNAITYGFCNSSGTTVPTGTPLFWVVVDGEPGACVKSIDFTSAQTVVGGEICQPIMEDGKEICINGIKGQVKTCCSGDPMEGVTITMISSDPTVCGNQTAITDSEGNYAVCICPGEELTYQVTPSKDGEDLCGVNTLDLVLIQRHILGLAPLTDPCDIIAADVNCDGKLTATDLLELRKLILGVTLELDDCDSWAFVDADYNFPDPSNPFDAPGSVNVTLPDSEANFTGIKKGDVNCECEQSSGTVVGNGVVSMEDRSMTTGEEVWVAVKGVGLSPVLAYQFGFEYDPTVLEITEVSVGDVPYFSTDQFFISNGALNTSWISGLRLTGEITDGSTLFQIKVKANAMVTALSNEISLSSTGTPRAMGFGALGESYGISLEYRSRGSGQLRSTTKPSSDLMTQIYPNPVSGNTLQVRFDLPQSGTTTLEIYDVLGRRVYYMEETLDAGGHQRQITGIDQWGSGIYTYSLSTNGLRQSGKIVIQ